MAAPTVCPHTTKTGKIQQCTANAAGRFDSAYKKPARAGFEIPLTTVLLNEYAGKEKTKIIPEARTETGVT